jgi:polyisoprenoid-binding protein YceI
MENSTWLIDPTHSEIGFKVKHMMFTNVSGKFNSYEATIINFGDYFKTSKISFSADTNSIDTNNSDRDNHLKSAEFLETEKYPKLFFEATNIIQRSDNFYEIEGDLTIKNTAKKILLNAEYSGVMKDPWGNIKVGLSISGSINRKDFGLLWNATLESGGVLVGEDIKLLCEIQLVKQ